MLDSFLPDDQQFYVFISYCFVTSHHRLVVKTNTQLLPAIGWLLCSGFLRAWKEHICQTEFSLGHSKEESASKLSCWARTGFLGAELLFSYRERRGPMAPFFLTGGPMAPPSSELESILTVENIFSCGLPSHASDVSDGLRLMCSDVSLISVSDFYTQI